MSIYKDTLKKYWGYSAFRPLQEDIIRSVAEDRKDTLGLLPTGGGKSIIFQVPALAQPGICLVVTPLIALMKDQVDNLKQRQIKATAVYSGMRRDEIDIALNNCVYGDYKFLYLSPERLGTELFRARVTDMNVNLLAIDESHCISQWGYDFRPSYLKIAEIRSYLPNVPVLALTATATPQVVDDIQEKLLFKQKNVFRKSFERKNLTYMVRQTEDKLAYLLRIVQKMNASGVVYVRNRKRTKETAEFLAHNGISADYYHAGLKNETKDRKQAEWKSGKCQVIVSTNAFGMGIDKADVRYVVHLDLPDSLEAYFQEAGRGGRDEKRAYAVLLYHKTDKQKLEMGIQNSYPPRDTIRRIYNCLGNFLQIPLGAGKGMAYDFNMSEFVKRYRFNVLIAFNGLKILQREGYIEFNEEMEQRSRVRFLIERDDLYKFQVSNEQFDAFIRLLLRAYTGLFTDYTTIDEDELAKHAKTTRQVIYEYLKTLSQHKIINYIPQKKCPMVTFTAERLEDKSLFISRERYEDRKKDYETRVAAVINYATRTDCCRSQMLLQYFGQKNAAPCGQCDVCKSSSESGLSRYAYQSIRQKAEQVLAEQPLAAEQLTESLLTGGKFGEQAVLKAIQYLLDTGTVSYNADMLLAFVSNEN